MISFIMDYLYGGVDQSLAGNGGPGCSAFRSPSRKVFESLLLGGISLVIFKSTSKYLNQSRVPTAAGQQHTASRQLILVVFTLMFGIQIGFKFATKQVIYLLQPCHMMTFLQIYLLASPVHKYTGTIFRLHIGLLQGPLLAVLFPVTDTLTLPFEVEMYWIQHLAILLLPFYLYKQGEPYHPSSQISYGLATYGIFLFYHVAVAQLVSIITGVNISTTLCPAPTDPFYGPNYILHAAWHQGVVICLVVALYSYLLPRVSSK